MPIEWRDAMSVDGAKIDEDHRHLIDILNRFEEESQHFERLDDALEILYALKFYAKTHFEREEHLQRLAGFTYSNSHAQEHTDLIKKLDHIIEETRSSNEADIGKVSTMMTELLKSWLLDHVLKSDLRMKPFVEAMAPHMGSMRRLDEHKHGK